MGQLRDSDNERDIPLRAHHTIGRCTERADTVYASPITSRIHMSLEWDGGRWNVRDLSKNGTWLGETRLRANESVPVKRGDTFHLGAPDTPGLQFVDDSPPRSALLGIGRDTPTLNMEPFIFLPGQTSPEAVLIYSHARHSWLLHPVDHDNVRATEKMLRHGDVLRYGDYEWQVFLAETGQITELRAAASTLLNDFEFVFDLSQDEENTSLQLLSADRTLDLGERSHHYLLLHLARLRAAEAAQGQDQKTQGWVDNEQLKKDLGMDMPHINIMIFRARKQIAESTDDPLDSEQLVERGKGRMRFGCRRCKIFKGETLAYILPPRDNAGP